MSQEQSPTFAQYPSLSSFFRRREEDEAEDCRAPKRLRGSSPEPASGEEGQASGAATTPPCQCSPPQPSALRVVQKEGPNRGRAFYVCPRPRGTQCPFFEWADATSKPAEPPQLNSRAAPQETQNAATCRCGEPAVLKTVQKEGSNKGRGFWCCAKSRGGGCNFFSWSEDTSGRRDSAVRAASAEGPSDEPPSRVDSASSTCFKCGLTGHWARNCPASQPPGTPGRRANRDTWRRS